MSKQRLGVEANRPTWVKLVVFVVVVLALAALLVALALFVIGRFAA
ncbi:MAG: hypothetical protein LBK54_05925 [Propionibacteriaceae bacterium]|jgi:hypothetical protein|nr:hypothetical protein [Propionibacteriaceae bacterium]